MYVTVRQWCQTFGQTVADGVRRRRSRPGDTWYLDEVQRKSNGRKHSLWRTMDQQEVVVLDNLVQERRHQEAAETFLRRLLNGQGYEPCVVITDKLASCWMSTRFASDEN